MPAPAQRSFPFEGPLDLGRSMRLMWVWGAAPWMKVDDAGVWYARRTEEGPATVLMRAEGDTLHALGWGPGAEPALDAVPELAGLHDRGVDAIETDHPFVRDLVKRNRGTRLGRTGDPYPALVAAAFQHKVVAKGGKASMRALVRAYGERAPGPRDDLGLLPEPRVLAAIPYERFHPLNVERRRAETIRRIAARAPALRRAAAMRFGEARAHLEKLPGIGPWTSGVVMGGPMGDPDAYPVGDYHLPNWVAWNLAGEPRGDDARMAELLEPFAGHRGRVARMIKSSGSHAPRYGPKLAVQDIRGI